MRILSEQAQGLAPFTIEIIDAEGEIMSFDMSEDRRLTPHQEFDKHLTFPCSVVLADGGPRGLEMVIAQPERVQSAIA